MNKSKIDWCDYTWNPVTGCLHGCEYCYARRIAERFCMYPTAAQEKIHTIELPGFSDNGHSGDCKDSYPYVFDPTFHRYRLDEPQKIKQPSNIFVVSMGDLFGDWVPDGWIQKVFEACLKAPQHKYLFLTKNPKRYHKTSSRGRNFWVDHNHENFWFGATGTGCQTSNEALFYLQTICGNTFLSIEPLLNETWLNLETPCGWVIIGAETGNRKGKVIPKKEWIQRIVDDCRAAGVPVFMKHNLAAAWGEDLIREWPEGLRGE